MLKAGKPVTLGDLLRDPADRKRDLAIVPIAVEAARGSVVMPETSYVVRPGYQILLCGTRPALRKLDATLNNDYTLRYLITGVDEPRGLFAQWALSRLARRRHGKPVMPAA